MLTTVGHFRARAIAALLALTLVMAAFAPNNAQAKPPEPSFTFSETGKTVSGRFLEFWSEHGGTSVNGLPLTEEIEERSDLDGKTYNVQYFERAVFELHPANKPPYDVLLSHLGVFEYKRRYPKGAQGQVANTRSSARLFPETGKRVGCEFLDYWERTGGLARHGYPISEEFVQVSEADGKPYMVQYFERSVFEWHHEALYRPENRINPYQNLVTISLGTARLVGKDPAQVPSGVSTPTTVTRWACPPTGQGPSFSGDVEDAPVRSSVGKGHLLTGVVKSSRDCSPLAGARIIFWLAGPDGNYDDAHRAMLFTDSKGAYTFESNFPAYYGAGGPHIHLHASATGYRGVETEIFLQCNQTRSELNVALVPK